MPQQLKQDGQLGQLGLDMLEVDVAPLDTIVSNIFRKVRDKENTALGEEGQQAGRSHQFGGRRDWRRDGRRGAAAM